MKKTDGMRAVLVATCLALCGMEFCPAVTCDVCVVGGGVAGVAAALQAGRSGARTVLVEQAAMVGGNMTSGGVNWPGLFHAWGRQVIDGCGWELVTNCVALAGGTLPDFSRDPGRWHWKHQVRINAPLWVALAEEALGKAGVEIRYHTAPKSARARDDGWELTLSAIGEESTLHARVLIDATGNGALAALCGAKRMRDPSACQPGSFTYLINPHADESAIDWPVVEKAAAEAVKDGRLEPTDMCRGVRFLVHESNVVLGGFANGADHGTTVANYVVGADNSTAALRTKTNMRGRAAMLRVYRFLRSQPGFEKAALVEMSPEVGVRETYRVEGEYLLTGDDYASGRVFVDSVCSAFYPIDMHSAEKGVHPKHLAHGTVATVPLRALEARGTRNLLVAGRCVSADRAANSALRVQATCMATGQAAGAAAALAARKKCDVRQLPLDELKSALRASGAIVPDAECPMAFEGSWITDAEMAALAPRAVEARQLARGALAPLDVKVRNRHILFRRAFELGPVTRATVRISADDYYHLYVNGVFAGQGPAAGIPEHTYGNEIDVTALLKPGRNVLAIHTYYQGLVNRVWRSGDNRHGLILDLVADGQTVVKSDPTFRVARHRAYSAMGIVGYDTQFMERYDAGAPEVGFERPDFDDSAWASAVVHPHGGDYTVFAQPTPMLIREEIRPVRTERLASGALRLDFGGIYVGALSFAATGPKGATVGIRCGQELAADGSVRHKMRCNCDYVEEMRLSGGKRDELRQYDYKSFRYAELEPSAGATLDADSIRLVARHQPFTLAAEPNFGNDPALAPVWKLCVDTFRYGVQEQIQDCMDREKGYYLGDGCWTMWAYCRLTGDWSHARRFFDDFLRTRRIDRGLVTCANCSFMQEIAEYPLMMIFFMEKFLDETGDLEYVRARYEALADILDSYRTRYARADGLLANLDKWCVVEWPNNFQDGYDADVREGRVCTDVHNAINAWYVGAVKTMNALAARLGRSRYADADALASAFDRVFWNADRKLFVDREGSSHVSLPGNVYAALFRLEPSADAAAFRENFRALVRAKGYSSVSMFQFVPLFLRLQADGEKELLHELLASPDAWHRILREGGTRTFEGWGRDTKWNTSLFHLTVASAVIFLCDSKNCE